ncbi:MAG: hypothetical protein IJE07_12450 [Clostridia bacterium]|nr:hypothetical protein [Clostridia bacterium]
MPTTRTCSRVCAVGREADMITLCRALLSNRGWLPEEDETPLTLEQLRGLIRRHAHKEGGEDCGFFYDMVAAHPYGAALASACRFEVKKHPCGVWTALFVYGGDTPFQPEDWLNLHRQCGNVPMVAMYADWDFGLEKGMKRFVGGKVGDDWERMGEVWMWLTAGYQDGYPPEESVLRLRKLQATLEREDFDMTIGELLAACIDNLTALDAETADAAALAEHLHRCREEKDFTELLRLYLRIAETALWESDRVDRWLANLTSDQEAWRAAGGL